MSQQMQEKYEDSHLYRIRHSAAHVMAQAVLELFPDGKFTIAGLDAGTYELTAWHERLGTQTASVAVSGRDTKSENFKFAVKP